MSDQKLHHPFSPSKMERLSLCPGSFNMCAGIHETSRPEADEGTMLHKAVETGSDEGLNAEQIQAVEFCREIVHQYEGFSGKVLHEVEMPLIDGDMNVVTSGTADVVIIEEA